MNLIWLHFHLLSLRRLLSNSQYFQYNQKWEKAESEPYFWDYSKSLKLIYVLKKLKLILRRETTPTCYICEQMKFLSRHSLNKSKAIRLYNVCQWKCTNTAGDRQIILGYSEHCADAAGLGHFLVTQNMSSANISLHKTQGVRIIYLFLKDDEICYCIFQNDSYAVFRYFRKFYT